MAINPNAPVVGVGEVRVQAPPPVVWTIMSTISEWPRWNPEISTADLVGPLASGSTFRWRSGPGAITSVLREVRPDELIEWTGRTLGVSAIHVWRIPSRIASRSGPKPVDSRSRATSRSVAGVTRCGLRHGRELRSTRPASPWARQRGRQR